MKCRFCGNEIEDGSLFCGYCGKEQPKMKYCVQCGREIDADAEFCGYCGRKQSVNEASTPIADAKNDYANLVNDSKQELQSSNDIASNEAPKQAEITNNDINSYTDEDETNSSKKWYIIGAIVLITVLGVYFYSNNHNFATSNEATNISNESKQGGLSENLQKGDSVILGMINISNTITLLNELEIGIKLEKLFKPGREIEDRDPPTEVSVESNISDIKYTWYALTLCDFWGYDDYEVDEITLAAYSQDSRRLKDTYDIICEKMEKTDIVEKKEYLDDGGIRFFYNSGCHMNLKLKEDCIIFELMSARNHSDIKNNQQ